MYNIFMKYIRKKSLIRFNYKTNIYYSKSESNNRLQKRTYINTDNSRDVLKLFKIITAVHIKKFKLKL